MIFKVDRRQRSLGIPPRPGDVVASNHTSPLDIIYLAGKYGPFSATTNNRYDVVFVSCFMSTDKVQQTSFTTALWRSLRAPLLEPPASATLLSLQELSQKLSSRVIAIFPEVASSLKSI
jgi:1-acyl-sn-glycerol-3-phosphate acyltransferase